MSSQLSLIYRLYKMLEEYAQMCLSQAQEIARRGTAQNFNEEIALLVEATVRAAADVRRLRREARVHYGDNDPGHDQAINYVHEHIIRPARQLLDERQLFYDQRWTRSPFEQIFGYWDSFNSRPGRSLLSTASDNYEPVRACFLNPVKRGEAYFFANAQCLRIEVRPATTNDVIVDGPKLTKAQWSCLSNADLLLIDAVLPNPKNQREAYFFSYKRYALVNIDENRIVNGPHVITQEWPSLRQAGFNTIDAVLPNPKNPNEAYFFSKDKYALIAINPGTTNDRIVNGPKTIANEWPSLRQARFNTVDAALPNPNNSNEVYFFNGKDYVLINISPGTTNDYIVNGPKRVASEWPSLRNALFYCTEHGW